MTSDFAGLRRIPPPQNEPVRISRPPTIRGMSTRSAAIEARRALRSFFSGEPGP